MFKWLFVFFRKLRLVLCLFGVHKKKLDVGGYRCSHCGKYVRGKRKWGF